MDYKQSNYICARIIQLRRWQAAQRLKSEESLYYGQLPILEYIKKNPGCNQKEIADNFALSRATVTKSIKRMLKKDVVDRKQNKNDERQFELYATQKGIDMSEKCREVFMKVDEISFEGFTEEEFELYNSFIQRIMDNLETDYSRGKSPRSLALEVEALESEKEK